MITNYYSRETVDKLIEVGFYEWTDSQYRTYANEKRYIPDVDVLVEWLRDEKDIYISISPDPDKYLGANFNVTIYTKDNDGMPNAYFSGTGDSFYGTLETSLVYILNSNIIAI